MVSQYSGTKVIEIMALHMQIPGNGALVCVRVNVIWYGAHRLTRPSMQYTWLCGFCVYVLHCFIIG